MTSGAGHDAMIVAARMPAAMLFLRSPGGISHHPDESVLRRRCRRRARGRTARSSKNSARRLMPDLVIRGGTVVTAGPRSRPMSSSTTAAIVEISAGRSGGAQRNRRARTCTSCPASSTSTCTSTSRAAPSGRARRPAAARWRPAAARCSSTCRSTPRPAPSCRAEFDRKRAALEAASDHRLRAVGRAGPGSCRRDGSELAARGVVGFKAFMCDFGTAGVSARRRSHAARGHARSGSARTAGRGAR